MSILISSIHLLVLQLRGNGQVTGTSTDEPLSIVRCTEAILLLLDVLLEVCVTAGLVHASWAADEAGADLGAST